MVIEGNEIKKKTKKIQTKIFYEMTSVARQIKLTLINIKQQQYIFTLEKHSFVCRPTYARVLDVCGFEYKEKKITYS